MTGVVKEISKQVIKSHNDTMKTIGEQKALYDADLAATKISIEQTTKALKNFFKTGAFEATTGFETYIKKKANQAWDLEKTKAEEWTTDLNQRLQEELKAKESVVDEEEKDELGEKTVEPNDTDTDPEPSTSQQENLDKLSAADLKERCKSLGLQVSGKKADLIQRIKTSLENKS